MVTRRKRLGGTELTVQLNHMVAELIKENRKLKQIVADPSLDMAML